MIESPWLHLTSLIISSIWFGIACFDVIPCSPAILVGCLAFTLATAFVYWIIASQTCVGDDGQPKSASSIIQKTPSDTNERNLLNEDPSQSKKPNWFQKMWKKIKNWMKNLSPSGHHPEAEGIIIVQQEPKIKYLVSNSELGFTPDELKEDESPSDAAQRSVTEKTALKPKDLNFVPNFSKEAVIESTDPEGNPEHKHVIYRLAEISPETKVPEDSKWVTPDEALKQFPEMKPVISACTQKLTDPENEYEINPKATGVDDAPLQKWFRDPENDVIWRVVDRSHKIVAVGSYEHPSKRNPCFKPIVITAIISIISTLIVVGAVVALLHFFPDIFSQIWGGIVQAATSVIDAIKKLFGK